MRTRFFEIRTCGPGKQHNPTQISKAALIDQKPLRTCDGRVHNHVESASGAKQKYAPIRGFANKAAEHAARIAGTVQLFEDPQANEIQFDAMFNATFAVLWYLDEALRISGSFNPAEHLLNAEKVLRWIHEKGLKKVTLPDMYQRGPVRSAEAARKVVGILKSHNHLLEPKTSRGTKKGSIPSMNNGKMSREWWEVHPESGRNIIF